MLQTKLKKKKNKERVKRYKGRKEEKGGNKRGKKEILKEVASGLIITSTNLVIFHPL